MVVRMGPCVRPGCRCVHGASPWWAWHTAHNCTPIQNLHNYSQRAGARCLNLKNAVTSLKSGCSPILEWHWRRANAVRTALIGSGSLASHPGTAFRPPAAALRSRLGRAMSNQCPQQPAPCAGELQTSPPVGRQSRTRQARCQETSTLLGEPCTPFCYQAYVHAGLHEAVNLISFNLAQMYKPIKLFIL
jgi:hypothetical protein